MVCLIEQREVEFVSSFDKGLLKVSCLGLLSGIIVMIISVNVYTKPSRGYGIDLQHILNTSIPLSVDVEVLGHKCEGIVFIPIFI